MNGKVHPPITEHLNKDLLGQEILEGDYIAYPNSLGRSPGMAVYKVITITPSKETYSNEWEFRNGKQPYTLRAQKLVTNQYGGPPDKPSTLQFPERGIVLNDLTKSFVEKLDINE